MAGSLTIDNINGKVISSSPVATESQVIGVGQTWQDVTASRVGGTTYTNTTGKPIMISVSGTPSADLRMYMTINGQSTICDTGTYSNSAWTYGSVTNIIPNGSTYSVYALKGIAKWLELR